MYTNRGLANNGTHLFLVDGTKTMSIFELNEENRLPNVNPIAQIDISFDGRPLAALTEIEYIHNRIWANHR